MGDHPCKLFGVTGLKQTAGDGDRAVFGVVAGGERVRLAGLEHVHGGHRQLGTPGQPLDQADQIRRRGAGHRLRIAHAQHRLVRFQYAQPFMASAITNAVKAPPSPAIR